MRWVERGPEPDQVAYYRLHYTQEWVDHFRQQMGQRSLNLQNYWREFRDELGERFLKKCGYCERRCDGRISPSRAPTVDHFRPLNKFPERAYEWNNWVFSCKRCNDNKTGEWPDTGYVDPCADDIGDRPEKYLDFDELTGYIFPKSTLMPSEKLKAQNTIRDVALNALDISFYRIDWVREFKVDLLQLPKADRQSAVDFFTQPDVEYAGIIGMVAKNLRQAGEL